MNLKEVLKMADEIVFAKTGKHLDNLQEAILRGTLQGQRYTKIAEEIHCNENYVRQVGSELWQILSEQLGEDVSKSNFRSTMGRFIYSNVSNFEKEVGAIGSFEKDVLAIGSFNICRETLHPSNLQNSHPENQEKSNPQQPQTPHHDLSEMPELGTFYSRTPELETLTTWILHEQCRLISLTGITGIGKTSLAVKLVQQIKQEFEYILWHTINPSDTLNELQHQLTQLFTPSENLPLIKYFQKHRILIILDDIHNLFCPGELAGKYKPQQEEYRSFFKQIQNLSHQSCFILIGWEQPREIPQTESKNTPIRTLQLTGLPTAAAHQILTEKGLSQIDNSETLINLYEGNPLWLKSVATLIQDLGGSGTELLPNDTILLPEDLKDILEYQSARLSELEKQILSLLAKENDKVTLAKLLQNGIIPSSNLLNALQSLSRRCLIKQQANFYTLPPVLKEYLKAF